MSDPKSPYYFKKTSDTYHWESSCSKNHYFEDQDNWEKVKEKPSNREQCDECKAK